VRRHLVLGVTVALAFVAAGVASLWWLIGTVRDRSTAALPLGPRVIQAGFSIDGVLVGTDDRHLTVVSRTEACGVSHLVARESGEEIVLSIDLPDIRDPLTACSGKVFTGPYATVLPDPVGSRRIMDSFGQAVPRVDLADVLHPGYVPPGYRPGPIELEIGGTVRQRYSRPGTSSELDIEQGPRPLPTEPGPPNGHAIVAGVTADVVTSVGGVEVRWTVGAWHASVSIGERRAETYPAALRVARSMSK
jgi:hypothetical protein